MDFPEVVPTSCASLASSREELTDNSYWSDHTLSRLSQFLQGYVTDEDNEQFNLHLKEDVPSCECSEHETLSSETLEQATLPCELSDDIVSAEHSEDDILSSEYLEEDILSSEYVEEDMSSCQHSEEDMSSCQHSEDDISFCEYSDDISSCDYTEQDISLCEYSDHSSDDDCDGQGDAEDSEVGSTTVTVVSNEWDSVDEEEQMSEAERLELLSEPHTPVLQIQRSRWPGWWATEDDLDTNYLQDLFENFDGSDAEALQFYVGNPGDYLDATGFEQLLDRLAEQDDGGARGAPPAAKSAVEKLSTITIEEKHCQDEGSLCAICKDVVAIGLPAKQLPCSHFYHSECILPWLCTRNSCPVCRFELPTDDLDYEEHKRSVNSLNILNLIPSPESRLVEDNVSSSHHNFWDVYLGTSDEHQLVLHSFQAPVSSSPGTERFTDDGQDAEIAVLTNDIDIHAHSDHHSFWDVYGRASDEHEIISGTTEAPSSSTSDSSDMLEVANKDDEQEVQPPIYHDDIDDQGNIDVHGFRDDILGVIKGIFSQTMQGWRWVSMTAGPVFNVIVLFIVFSLGPFGNSSILGRIQPQIS